jgi:endo-1,4-beta-xylanase
MSEFTRRALMASAAAGLLPFEALAAVKHKKKRYLRHHALKRHAPSAAGTAPDCLNGLARAKGLQFGSCVGTGPSGAPGSMIRSASRRATSFADPGMRALMVSQCGLLVPENELKWYALRPSPTLFDFKRADILVDFAARHQMGVRGHTLLWNRAKWMPDWLNRYDFGASPWAQAERLLREHISTVCGRYGERIFAYDVINETIAPDTGELEESVFTKILGPDVVDVAFHTARAAAPHAQLVYNDYMGWAVKDEKHRTGVLKLLERMKKNNVPVDALGVQSHITVSDDPAAQFSAANQGVWRKFLDDVTAMGLDLVVTELDVDDKNVTGTIAERDMAVADLCKAYLDLMCGYPRLRYVMAWGLIDKYSWLQSSSPRPDGLPKRPCPYDDGYRPTPMREAIAASFSAAPARPELTLKPA